MPILPADADFRKDSRITCAAERTETFSNSSLRALTSTVFQKRLIARSVCPWRRSQVRNVSPLSRGVKGASAAIAAALPSLSAKSRQVARKHAGAVRNGAGSHEGWITEA